MALFAKILKKNISPPLSEIPKNRPTITLGRVSFGCGIFCRASSSCCTLKVFVSGGR